MLTKAHKLATKYHRGQVDKAGKDYMIHLETVSQCCSGDNEIVKVVALLHDILEDTCCTVEVLEACGFSNEVVEGVRAITKVDGEDYQMYLDRVKNNEVARVVKICDLKHNMDLSRLSEVGEEDIKRWKKYKGALEYLSL